MVEVLDEHHLAVRVPSSPRSLVEDHKDLLENMKMQSGMSRNCNMAMTALVRTLRREIPTYSILITLENGESFNNIPFSKGNSPYGPVDFKLTPHGTIVVRKGKQFPTFDLFFRFTIARVEEVARFETVEEEEDLDDSNVALDAFDAFIAGTNVNEDSFEDEY